MVDVCLVSRGKKQSARSTSTIHGGMNFGVPATFGEPHGLCFSASGGIQPTLMHFDVAGIHIDRDSFLLTGVLFPESGPKSDAAPFAIVLIDGVPMSARTMDCTPSAAFAENEKDPSEDNLSRQRRASFISLRMSLEINVLWFLYAAQASAPEQPDPDVNSYRGDISFPTRVANTPF